MKLLVLNSGSDGNCYLLQSDSECLVIENGVPFLEVKKALNFNIRCIVGALSSHKHSDHHKYTREYERAGIPTFCPFECDEQEVIGKAIRFGGFSIQCFPLVHDVPCYGFYIKHKDMGKLLFITDTEYVPQNFSKMKVNHIMVEVNYIDSMADKELPQFEHKIKHHMSLSTACKFVEVNKSNNIRNVILLHLGQETTDPEEIISEVQKIVPCANVDIADKSKSWELNEFPF